MNINPRLSIATLLVLKIVQSPMRGDDLLVALNAIGCCKSLKNMQMNCAQLITDRLLDRVFVMEKGYRKVIYKPNERGLAYLKSVLELFK